MTDNYKVVYSGSLKNDANSEVFVREFMHLFKAPEHTARKLLTVGHAVTLKTKLDASAAERYRQVMDRIGMQVHLEHEDALTGGFDNHAAEFIDDEHGQGRAKEKCFQCGSHHLLNDTCLSCGADYKKIKALAKKRARRHELNMSVARMLRIIFPPLNKVTVFVIAVTLYTAFIYVEWLPSPLDLIVMLMKDIGRAVGASIVDMLVVLLVVPVYVLVVLLLVVAPLVMPFTTLDLRWACWLVVSIFVMTASASSIFYLLGEPHSLLNRLLLIYNVLWIAYLIYVVRFIEEAGFIVGNEQTDTYSPLIAAIVAVLFVHIATTYYSMAWAAAFVVGATSSASIVPIVMKLILKGRNNRGSDHG